MKKKRKKKAKKKVISKSGDSPNPLQRIEWFRIVLDEAHIIKDPKTWQSKAVCNLSAQRRTALTGTPTQNRIDDLYALVRFLRLDPFSDRAQWSYWCNTTNRLTLKTARNSNAPLDTVAMARVQTVLKFLAMRRTKETKGPDGRPILSLPPKYQRTAMLTFGDMEKARYDAMHQMYKEDFEEMLRQDTIQQNYATILTEILNLRLTCDHPDLVDQGKDLRRLSEGVTSVTAAIEKDGITRDRALAFFRLLRSNGAAQCTSCNREITMGLGEARDAMEEDGLARAKGKKTKEPEGFLKAVITRCQHVSCHECFALYAPPGAGWPRPKPNAPSGNCQECLAPVNLLLEVVQLEKQDFEELDGDDGEDSIPDDDPKYMDDDDDDDDNDRRAGSRKSKALGAAASSLRSKTLNDSLASRPDLSTKIHALVTDLIRFSMCNPRSRLYDEHAPKLDHVALTPEQIELERRAAETGRTLQDESGMIFGESTGMQGPGSKTVVRADVTEVDGKVKPGDPAAGAAAAATAAPIETVRVVEFKPTVTADGSITTYRPIKSVVFSQWTRMLNRIDKCIRRTGIKTVRLDGTMGREARLASLEAFKNDDSVEVFLISLRAGGFGLNLVTAARAYLVDPYW